MGFNFHTQYINIFLAGWRLEPIVSTIQFEYRSLCIDMAKAYNNRLTIKIVMFDWTFD